MKQDFVPEASTQRFLTEIYCLIYQERDSPEEVVTLSNDITPGSFSERSSELLNLVQSSIIPEFKLTK